MILLLGAAGGLTAQTLSFGEITLVTPATTPPSYLVDLILTAGTAYTGQFAGLQFDLNYDPTSLNVTVGLGAQTSGMQVNTVALSSTLSNPFCATTPCVAAPNNGPGQRAIIIGCCVKGQTTPTSTLIAQDGVVATLTVQAATSTVTNPVLTLMGSPYLVGTTSGIANGQNTGAKQITMAIGKGSNDPTGSGKLSMQNLYLVGSITPVTNDSSPNFGSGSLRITDTLTELFYQTGAQGYTLPPACSDYFDAMDTSPLDTVSTRGGDGQITITDTLVELFRQTGAQGYGTLPVRTPRGETCTAGLTAQVRPAPPDVAANLVLGPAQQGGASQELVPVYFEPGRELSSVAISFSIGDERSQLHFQAVPGMAPSISYDSTAGFVAEAFLSGFDAHTGESVLLGYVVGPTGSAANLKVFGVSAATLHDMKLFGVDHTGAGVVRR
jgi:hypothetical protein